MVWRLVVLLLVHGAGASISAGVIAGAGPSRLLWVAGGLVQCVAVALIVHLFYRAGFRDGVASVPLDGAGLASGDDQAFDSSHRWNAALGAWERLR